MTTLPERTGAQEGRSTISDIRRWIKDDLQLSPSQADFFGAWMSYVMCLTVSHPMDTVRTRWQTLGRSPITTLKSDRFLSLYAGVTTPIFAQGPLVAGVFAANEAARYAMLRQSGGTSVEDLSMLQLSAAGGFAGIGISVVQCPLTVIRLQQQNSNITLGRTVTAKEVLQGLWRYEGFRGLYRSWWLEACTNGIGRMAYFTAYEGNKRLLVKFKQSRNPECVDASHLNLFERFIAGYGTSITSWASVYPYDIIKNKVQADRIPGMTPAKGFTPVNGGEGRQWQSFKHCCSVTYKREGVKGFWKGYGLTVFRSGILTGTSLPLYEYLRGQLRGSNYEQDLETDSHDDLEHDLGLTTPVEEH